jgi:hypothetical protein
VGVGVSEGVLAVLGCGSGFSGRFFVGRLRMMVLVPLPFLFVCSGGCRGCDGVVVVGGARW